MASQPNVLLLFTDDQRFDTIAALGNPHIHTPNLDRLVARGTTFTNGYIMGGSSGAVCMPSRAMLHTGRTLYHIEREGQTLNPDHVTIGQALREAGYFSFGCGKWHNGRETYNRSFDDGREIYFGGMCDHWNVPAHDYDPTGRYESKLPICVDPMTTKQVKQRDADHIHAGYHSTDLLADTADRFIRDYDRDEPFFAYVAFLAPHDPRVMPQRYLDQYPVDQVELPPNFLPVHPFDNGALSIRDEKLAGHPRSVAEVREHLRDYYAMISHLDDAIGRIFDALEARGELENTIIVFAGDNGLAVGQHGLLGKQSNYDHSVHVPLIFAGPGIPENKRCDQFAYLLDIFPTLCDLTGTPIPSTVEGTSLAPAMRDDAPTRQYLHFAYTATHRAVRDQQFKLIETLHAGEHHIQLFDLAEDPHEMNNLAEQTEHRPALDRLRKALRLWQSEIGDDAEQGRTFWQAYDASVN